VRDGKLRVFRKIQATVGSKDSRVAGAGAVTTSAVIRLVRWAHGMISSSSVGELSYVRLVVEVLVIVFQLLGGRQGI